MRTQLTTLVTVTCKILWSGTSILLLAHIVFIFMSLSDLKTPPIARVKYVKYPFRFFMTEQGGFNKIKSGDGITKEVINYPFGFKIQNKSDASDFLPVTTVTGSITVDLNDRNEVLPIIFLKRMIFLLLFFIISRQLDGVFSSFRMKEPFRRENVKRIKYVAWSIMAFSPVIWLLNNLSLYFFNNYRISGSGTLSSQSFNLQYLFFGLLILIIAYAFETGSQLKEESDYTI